MNGTQETALHDFESGLLDDIGPAPGVLREVARTALEAGGKRMRPQIVYLSWLACGGDPASDAWRRYAVALEYLHTATLLHDDLIDGASLRRGETTAHKRFGPKEAVLGGDLLLARCLSLVAGGERVDAMAVLAAAAERVAVGEAMEVELARRDDVTEDAYFVYARAKTAALFSAAAELGALTAGGDRQTRKALADYGEAVGTAFQVADDVLDVLSTEVRLGKEPGADLRAGIPSLPVLLALGALREQRDGAMLQDVLLGTRKAEGDLAEALLLVQRHGAEPATATARRLVLRAHAALGALPEGDAVAQLHAVADLAVERLS